MSKAWSIADAPDKLNHIVAEAAFAGGRRHSLYGVRAESKDVKLNISTREWRRTCVRPTCGAVVLALAFAGCGAGAMGGGNLAPDASPYALKCAASNGRTIGGYRRVLSPSGPASR